MKTNYQNLNWFEASIVAWGFVGVVISGFIFYSSLTPQTQKNFSAAISIFDLNTEMQQAVENVAFIWNVQKDFQEQFYVAFTEIMSVPLDDFERPINTISAALNEVSQQVAAGYQTQIAVSYDSQGTVLGAVIDLTEPPVYEEPARLSIPYSYDSPDINLLNNYAWVEAY